MKNKTSLSENQIVNNVKSLAESSSEIDELAPFVTALFNAITQKDNRDVVVVCFGTDAISGDALGPRVGSLLQEKYKLPAFVYGTEKFGINGKNMKKWIAFIRAVHGDAIYVAVDASLGQRGKVGQIVIREDGVCPSGVTGKSARFGDLGILGVVAQNDGDPLMQLMSVSPLYINEMADKISNMINIAVCGVRAQA